MIVLKLFLIAFPMLAYYLIIQYYKKYYMLNEKTINTVWLVSVPIYLLFAYRYSFSPITFIYSLVLSALFSITAIDLDVKIIPNKIIVAIIGLGVINLIMTINNYKLLLGGFLFAYIFSVFLYFITKKSFGGGDVKLLASLGLLLGYYNIYIVLFLSFLFATIYGLVKIISKKSSFKSAIPFGPFIAMGFVILSFI